jgi:diguanylate cyclase (GGDEF)-like protein
MTIKMIVKETKNGIANIDGSEFIQDCNETLRLQRMLCYPILEAQSDANLDSITQMAIGLVHGDIGGISLIYRSEIWIPSRVGIDIASIPRAGSFCTIAIKSDKELFEIEDASFDVRLRFNALVTAPTPYLHYAAVPLRDCHGYLIGTLWMMRHNPGRLSPEEATLFKGMGKLVLETLELRHTNTVTGMPNRSMFLQHLQSTLEKVPKYDVVVGYIDIVAFRNINDTFGWTVGDEVLRIIGRRLNDWAGVNNLVAHIADNKFSFALINHNEDIETSFEGLKFSLTRPYSLSNGNVSAVHARVGIAQNKMLGSMHAPDLLGAAETAASSSVSKNSVQATSFHEYGDDMRSRSRTLAEFQAMLDGDTLHGKIIPFYQPQVDFIKGTLVGLEALARWQHPSKGLIQPGNFISLAENTGKIYQLDNLILDQVCADLRQWLDSGLAAVPVSFNYSRSSLLNHNVINDFRQTLERHGITGQLLELEITETQLLENLEPISTCVLQFRELGVRIAVDDFGTGYSNLDAINNFPFDRLKVDRQFVNGVSKDTRIAALFQMIHAIANLFEAELLCEGLEDIEDLVWLRSQNAHCVQGWYFSAARPGADIVQIFNTLRDKKKDPLECCVEHLRLIFS